jgi:Cu/Ag efflux pump CusA
MISRIIEFSARNKFIVIFFTIAAIIGSIYCIKNIPLTKVIQAVKQSNNDVGARLLEMSGTKYMIRAKGYIKSPQDLENTVIDVGDFPWYLKGIKICI